MPFTPRRRSSIVLFALTTGLLAVPGVAHADSQTLPTHTNQATGTSAKINELKLAGGVLYYEDDSATTVATSPVRSLFMRTVSESGGIVTVGAESAPVTGVGSFLTASGDRYAYSNAANTYLYLKGPGARAIALNPTTTTDVKLSGSSLLISTTTGDRLTDLVTGVTATLPAGTNLTGRYATWFNADGSVDRRDLTTGSTVRVRPAGGPTSCSLATPPCTVANSKTSAKVWGSYVLWRFDNETGWVNLPDLTRHYLPTSKGSSLGNGVAVAKDTSVPANLLLQDLNAGTPSTIATNVKKYTYDDRLVAWSDATSNAITVASITPPAASGSGRLLTADASPAFSPNGDHSGDTFTGEWVFTKPVDSWSLTISDSSANVVHTATGSSASGVVRTTWDGTGAADGAYTWTLSGTAADGDGALVGDDGAGSRLSGTVVIRRTAPSAPKVSVPALSTTLTTRGIVTSWASTTAPSATYVANHFDVAVAANRSTSYTTWLNNTGMVKATYLGVPGNTYRVKVRVRDNAGNVGPWTTSSPSILPFDDRSAALKYAGTWTAASVSSAYLGTEKYASLRGASVTYSGSMSGFRVVALKCKVCGKITVKVDGKIVATADTYATTTLARRLVYARTMSTLPALHTVTLVVQGTSGRPRMWIDGFGTLR